MTWAQVHAFRLARHHLDTRMPKVEIARAVGDMTGIQAQLMSAAELQVAVRVECDVKDVRAALWREKTLVKTWLMRGTLHLIPADDLPLYAAAMSSRWRPSHAWLKHVGMTMSELERLVAAIGEALDGQCLSREELILAIGRGRPKRIQLMLKSGWGGLLKPAARGGLLCFGPSRGQSVTFVRPQQWLGRWRTIDPDAALVEVARRYLRAFGPATSEDFARWWAGAWRGVGKAAWQGLHGELVDVSVEGLRGQLLATDLAVLESPPEVPAVQLLPGFDSYLMGHANRDHLVEVAYRSRVSRTSGWISPVVLYAGRCVAVWSHQVVRDRLRVAVQPFRRLAPQVLPEIKKRAKAIGEALGLDRVEVVVG